MDEDFKNSRNYKIFQIVRIAILVVAIGVTIGILVHMTKSDKKTEEVVSEEITDEEIEEPVVVEPEVIELGEEINETDSEDPQVNAAADGEQIEANQWITSMSAYETGDVTYGIDVAKYQGIIDWQQVADAGIDFAMIRVGYRTQSTGVICEDPIAKYNMQEATAAGIQIGAYFFSTAITEDEAIEEAKWVTNFIASYPITYPVAYNCEGFSDSGNRQYGMSNADRTDMAIAFLDYIAGADYTPMFYASKNELTNSYQWDTDRLSSKYKIWVAQYGAGMEKADYSGDHAMWQYTNQGRVDGIGQNIDLNIAYFSYSQSATQKSDVKAATVEANLASLVNFTDVNETVTAKEVTNLRSEPSSRSDSTIVVQLKNGETVTRTGVGSNGWSRLDYNGQVVYAITSFLTTDSNYQPTQADTTPVVTNKFTEQAEDGSTITYTIANENITAKETTNLRSTPSTASGDTIVGSLSYGQTAVRVGVGDNGWSKLEYNGQTVYAMTKYLTTDLNYQVNTKPTLDNPESGMNFVAVNDNVTAKIEVNLRSIPSTSDGDTTVVAKLAAGEVVNRIGKDDAKGWSKVNYNGQTLYAVSSYLYVVE